MGICLSSNKESYTWEKDHPRKLKHKTNLFQLEIKAILKNREEETEAYKREIMHFALKEAELKKERQNLRDEVKRLRKSLEKKEERIRLMEVEVDHIVRKTEGFSSKSSSPSFENSLLVIMEMERREETIEKWKMLYLAIKNELDDLILKAHQGTLNLRPDNKEDFEMEKMQSELKAKDEIIQALKAQIVSMENDEYVRSREVDILRQSFKIMSNNKKGSATSTYAKSRSKPSIRLNRIVGASRRFCV